MRAMLGLLFFLLLGQVAAGPAWHAVGSRFGNSTHGWIDVFTFNASNEAANIQTIPMPQENLELAVDPHGSFVCSRDGLRLNLFQVKRDGLLELKDTLRLSGDIFFGTNIALNPNGTLLTVAVGGTVSDEFYRDTRSYRINAELTLEDTGSRIDFGFADHHISSVGESTIVATRFNPLGFPSDIVTLLHLSPSGEISETGVVELLPTRVHATMLALSPRGDFALTTGSGPDRTAVFTIFRITEGPEIELIDFSEVPFTGRIDDPKFLPNLDSFIYGIPFSRGRLSPTGEITGEFAQVPTNTDHPMAPAPDSLSALVNHNNNGSFSELTVFGLPPNGGIVDPGPALFGPQLADLELIPPRLADGDCNSDGRVDAADVVRLVNHLDGSAPITIPGCLATVDFDEDLVLEASELEILVDLILGTPPPPSPLAPTPASAPDGAWMTPEAFQVRPSDR